MLFRSHVPTFSLFLLLLFFVTGKSEQRDFLATGAACGICTAFRAPLAGKFLLVKCFFAYRPFEILILFFFSDCTGTLFVVEEAASFFTTRHLEFTFFACLAAYWCQWILVSSFTKDGPVFRTPSIDLGLF